MSVEYGSDEAARQNAEWQADGAKREAKIDSLRSDARIAGLRKKAQTGERVVGDPEEQAEDEQVPDAV